jgi:hypothetical protein
VKLKIGARQLCSRERVVHEHEVRVDPVPDALDVADVQLRARLAPAALAVAGACRRDRHCECHEERGHDEQRAE